MFQHQGIWLPDGEKHFPEWMSKHGEIVDGKGTYQIKKLRAAMEHVRDFRVAIDVGAHVGLWSMHLAKRFAIVQCFGPVAAFRECWYRNVEHGDACVQLHNCALGAMPGKVRMHVDPADSGGTHIDVTAEGGNVDMLTIDGFGFELLDFIKIDCEGFEHHVLAGACETLARCKPCVIVEQKPHKLGPNFGIQGTPAVDFLRELGAQLRQELSGDFVMSWDAP